MNQPAHPIAQFCTKSHQNVPLGGVLTRAKVARFSVGHYLIFPLLVMALNSAAQTCAPAPPGLLSWWAAEGSGNDSVGTNTGTLVGGLTFTNGEVGQAFSFDGVDDYVIVSDSPSLNFGTNQDFSIEAWIRPQASLTTFDVMTIVDKRNAPDPTHGIGYEIALIGGRLECRISDSIADAGTSFGAAGPDLRDGNFHHVAVTLVRNSTNGSHYYVDGVAVLTFNPTAESGDLANGQPLRIGNHPTPGVFANFKGRIDELSIYNRALSTAEVQAIYNAGSAGKCLNPASPFIVSQPTNQTVTVGDTATFSVVAGGAPPLSYQWQMAGTNLPGATNTFLTLPNVQLTQAGSYSVLVTNALGSTNSANALLTVNFAPAVLRVVDTPANGGNNVTVPVQFVANGNENALGFSLQFDPSLLTFSQVSLGSGISGAFFLPNTSQVANGKVGFAIALSAGNTFVSGTQVVVNVTFATAPVASRQNTVILFADQPITRQLVDAQANVLAANYSNGTVSIAATEYEADVSPRPGGDKLLTITDWVQVGRFVASLDPTNPGSEFQRADCAPRATRGNGHLTVTDWVQTGRYVSGLDPQTPAGGPISAHYGLQMQSASVGAAGGSSIRTVRILDVTALAGEPCSIAVHLEGKGDENALGFSLSFDPATASFVSASLGSGAAGAVLNMNTNLAPTGRIGFVLALPAGTSFSVSNREIIKVTLAVSPTAEGSCSLALTNQPVSVEISDTGAGVLPADYINATLTVISFPPALSIHRSGADVLLSWPAAATNFVLQTNATLSSSSWGILPITPTINDSQNHITLPALADAMFYRLMRP